MERIDSLEQKEKVERICDFLEWALAWIDWSEDENVVYKISDLECDGYILYVLRERCNCDENGKILTADELRYCIKKMINLIKEGDIDDDIMNFVISSNTLSINTKKGYVKIKKIKKKVRNKNLKGQ